MSPLNSFARVTGNQSPIINVSKAELKRGVASLTITITRRGDPRTSGGGSTLSEPVAAANECSLGMAGFDRAGCRPSCGKVVRCGR